MSLNIHKVTKADKMYIKFIAEEITALNWKIGSNFVECFVAVNNDPGIFVAELDGVPIGCVSFYKYSSTYYSFGMYIVNEKYRGKGYGLQIFDTVMKMVDWSQNIFAYAGTGMVDKYKQYGFQPRWLCAKYELQLSAALEILKTTPLRLCLTVKDLDEVDQEALLSYDTTVFGYQRRDFILKWLSVKESHTKVVTIGNGDIVGYGVANVAYVADQGYMLGPLFADSTEAVQVLLKALFEDVICRGLSSSQCVIVYCPIGINTKSKTLVELLQGRLFQDMMFITTKEIPNGCFDKWFGITELQM